MSNVVKLPSGATATFRDPKTLKVRDRRAIMIAAGDDTLSKIERGLNMKDALIAALVSEWSFDLLPPSVKLASLDELDLADYDALSDEAEKAMPILYPTLGGGDDQNSPLDNSTV
jgi:hypothetical protein